MRNNKIYFFIITLICFFGQYNVPAQWIELNTGITKKLTCMSGSFATNPPLWICGDSGTVLKSTNSGINWINISGNGIPGDVNLVSIHAYGQTAEICGNSNSSAYLYRTTNGGNNWVQVLSQPNGFFLYVDGSVLLGNPVGGRWSIWKYHNPGYDSTGLYLPQTGNEHGYINSCSSPDGSWDFNFGTNNGRLYRYQTYYGTFTQISTLPETDVYADKMYGYNYIGGANVWYTNNWGASWAQENVPGSGNIVSMIQYVQPFDPVWCIRQDNNIYYKDTQGLWHFDYSCVSGDLTFMHIQMNSQPFSSYVFVLKNNGGILRRPIPGVTVGVKSINSEVPSSFSLSQNYPNPFNPATSIKFSVPQKAFVSITIYNVLGVEVSKLVYEEVSPGTYETIWEASNYPSGVYYYKLEAAKYTETKKMVLIK